MSDEIKNRVWLELFNLDTIGFRGGLTIPIRNADHKVTSTVILGDIWGRFLSVQEIWSKVCTLLYESTGGHHSLDYGKNQWVCFWGYPLVLQCECRHLWRDSCNSAIFFSSVLGFVFTFIWLCIDFSKSRHLYTLMRSKDEWRAMSSSSSSVFFLLSYIFIYLTTRWSQKT